jgi:hypothetical protein
MKSMDVFFILMRFIILLELVLQMLEVWMPQIYLKPALSKGLIRCMGSTTYDEFRKFFEKDQALTRRFQKIDVHEPSIPDTIQIS